MSRAAGLARLGAAVLGCVVLGCSGGGGAAHDAGAVDGPFFFDAAPERPLVCADAAAPEAVEASAPSGPMTCGGEVAISGPTTYGVFVAKNVSLQVGLDDCYGLSFTFDDGSDQDAGAATPIVLSAFVPTPDFSMSGTFDAIAALKSGNASEFVAARFTLMATDDFFPADGGSLPPAGVGPRGLFAGSVDVDTGCGHVTGTFSVPACRWDACVTN